MGEFELAGGVRYGGNTRGRFRWWFGGKKKGTFIWCKRADLDFFVFFGIRLLFRNDYIIFCF